MGNAQGRSASAPQTSVRHKSPRSGKYPVSQTRSVTHKNGFDQHLTKQPSNRNERVSHHPRVEFDLPEFLQNKQERSSQSPVVQRHLRDPDPVIIQERANRGLLIPKAELQVPDFLNKSQPNGRVSFSDEDSTNMRVPYVNKPVRAQMNPHVQSRTPTKNLYFSYEQLDVESDSKRHRRAPQRSTDDTIQTQVSPPKARGTVVIGTDSSVSKALHSKSMGNLQQNNNHVPPVDVTPEFVDDFGSFSLQRKYKKKKERDKTCLSLEERLAPGVTDKHASVKQPRPPEIYKKKDDMQDSQNGHPWSLTDTDSIQSVSSLSFTDPTSSNSNAQQNYPSYQSDRHFQTNRNGYKHHHHHGYESADSALGYLADSSLTNQDSSCSTNENGKKVSRKDSLQAHLRHRVKEYEKVQQENVKHFRQDSDSTTISDKSVFGDAMSSVTRFSSHSLVFINSLQDDLLFKIFSYLPTLELCKISGVCTRWQRLAWDPILWNTIEIKNYEESDINRILRNVLATLAMSTQGYCWTVHRIKLNGSDLISDKGLGFIARYCIDLEELEISGCCCVTNKGLQDLFLNCHNLCHINLSGCTCVNSICLPSSNGFSMGDHGSFLKLQHLDLSDCVAFDDFGLRTVGLSCGLLKNLYLRRCSRITDVGMKHIANHCHHLKELSTSDCFKIRDFSLKEIARNLPGLKYLSVAKCPISDSGIKYIGRHCVRLKYLNLRGCEAITNIGIAYVVQNCLKLRSLDIGKCDITDSVMHTIGIHCPQLKKLSMKSCLNVSDSGIRSIAAQCCNLQYLNVQECDLGFDTFTYIREHCRNCIIEHTCPAFF